MSDSAVLLVVLVSCLLPLATIAGSIVFIARHSEKVRSRMLVQERMWLEAIDRERESSRTDLEATSVFMQGALDRVRQDYDESLAHYNGFIERLLQQADMQGAVAGGPATMVQPDGPVDEYDDEPGVGLIPPGPALPPFVPDTRQGVGDQAFGMSQSQNGEAT